MTPEQLQAYRWEREIDERNRPLADDELEALFPPGYKILPPPAGNWLLLLFTFIITHYVELELLHFKLLCLLLLLLWKPSLNLGCLILPV